MNASRFKINSPLTLIAVKAIQYLHCVTPFAVDQRIFHKADANSPVFVAKSYTIVFAFIKRQLPAAQKFAEIQGIQ